MGTASVHPPCLSVGPYFDCFKEHVHPQHGPAILYLDASSCVVRKGALGALSRSDIATMPSLASGVLNSRGSWALLWESTLHCLYEDSSGYCALKRAADRFQCLKRAPELTVRTEYCAEFWVLFWSSFNMCMAAML